MNFRNRRTRNGIKLKKLQLYVVARFDIHPTLSSSPARELQSAPTWQPFSLMLSKFCGAHDLRAKTWPSETGDELSVNVRPSVMKEKNGCSEEVGEDYADADGPNRKADCEGGDRRDLS